MKKTLSLLLLSAFLSTGCGSTPTVTTPAPSALFTEDEQAITQSVKEEFAASLDCGPDTVDFDREWCAVTQIGESDVPFTVPTKNKVYVGFSVPFVKGQTLIEALPSMTVSALHIGPDSARLHDMIAETDAEEEDLLFMIVGISTTLKNMGTKPDTIMVPTSFYTLVQEYAEEPFALTYDETGGKYPSGMPAMIYRVSNGEQGDVYVVIETPVDLQKYLNGDSGVYVSIYPIIDISESTGE